MQHYFSQNVQAKSNPRTISYSFGDNEFTFVTDTGVFSYGKMDENTDILLNNIPPLEKGGELLDLGCGFGCIGIVLGKVYGLKVTQTDCNDRAVKLTADNARRNGIVSKIFQSDGFCDVNGMFDTVALNPPVHAGKSLVFSLYEGAHKHLNSGGRLYCVILKKHGADSTVSRLTDIFGNCDILYKKKGCYVLSSERNSM